ATGARGASASQIPDLEIRSMLLLLVDRQIFDPGVVQLAASGGPELRVALATALGRIPDTKGRPVLQGLLEDASPSVRRAAAFALGELEDKEAVPALERAEGDADHEVGSLAVEALAKLGADVVEVGRALEALPEDERWARLTPSLFRFKQEERVPFAVAALGTADRERRFFAAYALARDPLATAAPPLRPLLTDADPRVRAWAARGLGQVGDGGDLALLRTLLDQAEISPVVQALRAGQRLVSEGRAHPEDDWREPLRFLISDGRAGVRATAIEAAGFWLPNPALSVALEERAERAEGWERGLAVVALAVGKDPRAAELAAKAAESTDPDVRARAAEAAGKLGDAALLARLAADPSAKVRAPAASAQLEAVPAGDTGSLGAALAASILADPDEGVRLSVLEWLEKHPVVPLATLAPAAVKALLDESEEPGLAALRALVARAKAVPAERPGVLELAGKVVETGRYVLRREAGDAFSALQAPRPELAPADLSRTIDDDREIVQTTWRPRTMDLVTSRGTIRLELACRDAPLNCLSFVQLAAQGFFDGLTFHRVVADFVIQGGDPRGDGIGGPGYSIRDEIGRIRYGRGVLGMALAGPDTAGSQFFLTLSPQPHLDGGFTAFGRVIGGDEVLDKIEIGDRIVHVAEVPARSR
ncbi:MAG TPA: peptidylprolyl isomerase, partial [Thermoanaerobaculia bacterium]|nr:peptidylprolyl isomerase [Thermoanaerobaculia bacterium]